MGLRVFGKRTPSPTLESRNPGVRRKVRSGGRTASVLTIVVLCASFMYGSHLGIADAQIPQRSTLVVAFGVDTVINDPSYSDGTVGLTIHNQIFEPLVAVDDNMNLRGVLAESWKPIGLLTWQFKLRKDVKFHSGAPFDADAVKFSLERLYDPEVKTTNLTVTRIPFDRIRIIDKYTVNITTKTPVATLPNNLFAAYMIDPNVYNASKNPINDRSSGTGPYKFVAWVRDNHFTIAANNDYWGGAPRISRIVFRPIPEASTRIAELLAGGAHLIQNVPPDQIRRIETSTTKLVVAPAGRDMFVGMRADKPPFNDVRVRQAVNYAVDRRAINENLLGGHGELYGAVVLPPRDNPNIKPYPYDPRKAKALLVEAGYPNGFAVTLQTPNGRYLKDKEAAQAIAGYLAEVGIKVTVEVLDWSVFFPAWRQYQTKDMFLLGNAGTSEGQTELSWVLTETSRHGWEHKEYRQLYNTLSITFDQTRRKEHIMRGQEIVFREAPWLFLWRQPGLWGASRLLDWKARQDDFISLKNAMWR